MPVQPRDRAPGMKDVARLAGVSHQTVSRVLNGNPNVSAFTRASVEQAMKVLGYRRNAAARTLITQRSRTIGVLGSDMSQYGPAATLIGVQQAARAQGYSTALATLSSVTPTVIIEAMEHLLQQAVDGIAVIAPHAAMLEILRSMSIPVPVVAVGFSAGITDRLSVAAVNQRIGASHALQNLIELGHTKIAHLSGPPDGIDATARIDGWMQALAWSALDPARLITGDWSAESGYRAGLELAASGGFTALFAANDQMALGALRAFHEAGFHVPDDVSVIGYDDQPEAGYFIPPLTTVNQQFSELGGRCLQVLLFDIANGTSGTVTTLSPKLVVRSSTAQARKGARF